MTARAETGLPVVAIVGRPNVGKSSLVNRILGRREAIVEETPGVTRDRRHFTAEWGGRTFEVVDTGGIEPGPEGMEALVADQASRAMDGADVILLVVDASTGPVEADLSLARRLRAARTPVIVVANKVDHARDEPAVADFWSLGLGEPLPVSALHGRRSGDLLTEIVARLPERHSVSASEWASVAIVGRPNVGKSSLLNVLLGENRSIVDSVPGTTRDPVDSVIEIAGERRLRLVDTAGMRREVALKDPLEYFSWLRSRKTLTRVDVAVLVVDVSEGVTGFDQRLAEAIVESGRACVIALNKWDLLDEEDDREMFERRMRRRLRFLGWASVARTSALTRRGVDRLMPAVVAAVEAHRRRLSTSEVNNLLADAQVRRPHPRTGGKSIRVLYAAQAGVAPPTFVLFTNARLQASYVRYLEHSLRDDAFRGTPLRLQVRTRAKVPLEP